MSRRTQNPWTPESKTGVNYFKHAIKHFLTPYGKTHGIQTSREILINSFIGIVSGSRGPIMRSVNWRTHCIRIWQHWLNTGTKCSPATPLTLSSTRPDPSGTCCRGSTRRFGNSRRTRRKRSSDPHEIHKDDTLKSLSNHLFAASGAMFSIATHLMTLETLFSHPAEFAKKRRESP